MKNFTKTWIVLEIWPAINYMDYVPCLMFFIRFMLLIMRQPPPLPDVAPAQSHEAFKTELHGCLLEFSRKPHPLYVFPKYHLHKINGWGRSTIYRERGQHHTHPQKGSKTAVGNYRPLSLRRLMETRVIKNHGLIQGLWRHVINKFMTVYDMIAS